MTTNVLAIGDFHIPSRARWIPDALEREVTKDKYDIVLCTGDLTSEAVITWLEKLGKEIYVVRGNMDHLKLPAHAVIDVEQLKIGVYHGAGIYPRGDIPKLTMKAKQLGVDVLVTGHTHYPQVVMVKEHKVVIVNPGSATGAWGGDERASLIPSFAVMQVDKRNLRVQVKEVKPHGIEVAKYEFTL
ncbi:MAG: YfcE family phosphodiesterase [Thermoprotei archaeon]|nr:MAG: YfcE family phosphodiesterase [Thermoprotei archaeon]